jgi:hypothetical protein
MQPFTPEGLKMVAILSCFYYSKTITGLINYLRELISSKYLTNILIPPEVCRQS